jgi:hypothetical protein
MKRCLFLVSMVFLGLMLTCSSRSNRVATKNFVDDDSLSQLIALSKLKAERIGDQAIATGKPTADLEKYAGAPYKPSFNEDPAIPVQC